MAGCKEHKLSPPSSPAGSVFVDSIMNNVPNEDDQELSQIPYEDHDQLSDTLSSVNTPVSQSGTPLSSEYSSGYCSDSSYAGGSISSQISRLSFPEGAGKVLPNKDRKQDNFTKPVSTQTTAEIRNAKSIHSSLENSLTQMAESTTTTTTTTNSNKLKPLSVSPKSCSKETSNSRIPKPPGSRFASIHPMPKSRPPTCTASPLTVQGDELPLQNWLVLSYVIIYIKQ